MRAVLREIAITLVIAIVIFLGLQVTVQSFVIVGSSMQPSFHNEERLLINKVVYIFRQPERGEVIIFTPPNQPQADYIKRIIAIPGDRVAVQDGAVYINGTKLDEPYIKEPPTYTLPPLLIPEDNYFVLGDNRNSSNDSHRGWTLPRENIIGKAWLLFWPTSDWGLVQDYPLEEQLAASAE
jgi:signal peptidase I